MLSLAEQLLTQAQAYFKKGCRGHRGTLRYIHVQCDRLGVSPVNHIYYVHLRWGYVFRGVGGLLWLGNMVFVMEVDKTDRDDSIN